MIWPQDERSKKALEQAQRDFTEAVDQKAELFQRTQPSSTSLEDEAVSTSRINGTDRFDAYLIESERKQIDLRLKEGAEVVDAMRKRLQIDRELLEQSIDTEDRIYLHRFVYGKRVISVSIAVGLSEDHAERILTRINKQREEILKSAGK